MKTTANKNTPKIFPIETYRVKLTNLIGQKIQIQTIINQRPIKTTKGVLEYVSNDIFGLRVFIGASSYVSAFSFSDIFIGRIVLSTID